ncbi:MAG: TonB-dependent receptor [Thermoanaerobaculia bacterium]
MCTLRRGVTLSILLLLPARAGAQGLPAGSIAGSVTTESDRQPLPGVAVTVRSPGLQGTRRTVSAANGDFLLPNLPPGEYTVEAKLQGFRAVTRSGVRVRASQRQELAFPMRLEGVSGEVEVTAAGDLVSTAPQSATTMTGEGLRGLPVPRTIESAILLTPDVYGRPVNTVNCITTDAFSIAGAETYENAVTIDGVSPQENVFRAAESLYIEDAVAEVTTLTSGISAEHGYFVGGVVNVLTRSGGNAFSGSIRSTLVNDAWSATTPAGEERVSDVTPVWEATFGAPIWRDRLWLFASGRLLDQTLVASTAPPTSVSFPTGRKETRYDVKLTASPLASHTLTVAANGFDLETKDTYYPGAPVLDLDSLFDTRVEQRMLLANYTGTVTDSLFLEAHYGRRRRTALGGSTDTDLVTGTPLFYPTPWLPYHAPIFCSVCPDAEDHRDSDQGVLEATWFVPAGSLGSHTVVAGGEAYEGAMRGNNYMSGTSYWVFGTDVVAQGSEVYPVFGPGTMLWAMPVLVPAAANRIRTYSAFVNDTWRVSDRLSLNVGIRWDKNHARGPDGASISDADAFSPRLGIAWETGKGRLRLTASYGRYVSLLSETQVYWSSPYGLNSMLAYLYDGPEVNTDPSRPLVGGDDALRQLFGWFGITAPGQLPGPGFTPVAAFRAGLNVRIGDGLEPQKADEVTLGLNGPLGARGTWRVEAVQRTYRDFYDMHLDTTTGTVNDEWGNAYDLGILTNRTEPYERRHRALKASAQLRVGSTLTAGGAWTWSRTNGNQSSESLGDGPNPPATLNYPEYWQAAWHLPTGDLVQDVRHRIRLWATWDVPSLPKWLGSLSVSPLFALDTGQPYGAAGDVLVGDYVANPGYATPPYSTTYWFTGRDAYRTPTVTHLDLALNWSRQLGAVEAFVQAQVINVLDGDAIATNEPTLVDQGISTAAYDPGLQPFDPFHEEPVEGVHWAKSPTFGKALNPAAYQQPRTFRLSLGVRF